MGVVVVWWVWQQSVGCCSSSLGVTAVCWVWQQFVRCDSSWVGNTAVGWVWQRWGGCGSNGWLWLLLRISQVGVGAKVLDVVEDSRLFE